MEQSIPLLEDYGAGSEGPAASLQRDLDHDLEKTSPRPSRRDRCKSYLLLIPSLLLSALPRFLQPGGLGRPTDKIHPTAYLDALRGYAACIVVASHMFGDPPALQYPFLRMLTAGHSMVDVFFVISGYVLAFRMLKMMRKQDAGQLLQTLASSTFRRYLRLYVPTAIASFIAMIFVWLGWIGSSPKLDTFPLQLLDWVVDTRYSSNPFADIKGWWYPDVFRTKYLDQMWTIPVEFRGSIVLFAFCAASCKMSVKGRMMLTWAVVAACFVWNALYVALFLLGMFVAELSMDCHEQRQTIQLPQTREGELPARRRLLGSIALKVGLVLTFIFSLFLLSQPGDLGRNGPFPWQYLSQLVPTWYAGPGFPQEHFWLAIGAFLLVLVLEFSPALQVPLRWKFSLYLGDLSFGIYAMHNTVNWALFQNVLEPYRQVHMGESGWDYVPGVVITGVVVLWVSDYFERIDKKVVEFGRWLQERTFEKWES